MSDAPTIQFKRGDTFQLDISITDPGSVAAVAAAAVVVVSQAVYDAALVADPLVPADVAAALVQLNIDQALLDTALIVDITGWTITSKLRWCGKEIAVFTVTIVDALLGTLTIVAIPAVTQLWKIREHNQDIQFVRPEGTSSSQTIVIDVQRGATNG